MKEHRSALSILEEGHASDAAAGPRHFLVGILGGFILGIATPIAMGWWVP